MDTQAVLSEIDLFLHRRLFEISGTPVNVATLLVFVLILVVAYFISHALQRVLRRSLLGLGAGREASFAVTARLIHYVVMLVGVGIALNTLGINLTALFTAGAVFAIALGFAMQNIAQNFVSGVILLTERIIKPGDILEVDGRTVRVARLGIRSTVARTLDEEDIIIPNSILVQSTVKNHTLRDDVLRLRAHVGVAYTSDMRQVRQTLEEAARSIPWREASMEPVINLLQFGSSSVDWEISVWIDNPWRLQRLRSELNETVWWALKDAGITIAFPQVDVHLDPPVVEALHGVERR